MPLEKGTSKEAFSHNVSEMVEAGHPQKQAVAAAYREKRASDCLTERGNPARDTWSPEAREAAAAARSSGGGKTEPVSTLGHAVTGLQKQGFTQVSGKVAGGSTPQVARFTHPAGHRAEVSHAEGKPIGTRGGYTVTRNTAGTDAASTSPAPPAPVRPSSRAVDNQPAAVTSSNSGAPVWPGRVL